ncbi:hypothetical protein F5148DRAFT_1335833 [Russula earlei]|uniref:Uncharacterized protein n=1 Tax=Russula earlei TaxID=71964 RepID=A0ACC0TW55_9AGAM|nr:hypothetical protein F5148DRAFT_1335833 [Russula earlei]
MPPEGCGQKLRASPCELRVRSVTGCIRRMTFCRSSSWQTEIHRMGQASSTNSPARPRTGYHLPAFRWMRVLPSPIERIVIAEGARVGNVELNDIMTTGLIMGHLPEPFLGRGTAVTVPTGWSSPHLGRVQDELVHEGQMMQAQLVEQNEMKLWWRRGRDWECQRIGHEWRDTCPHGAGVWMLRWAMARGGSQGLLVRNPVLPIPNKVLTGPGQEWSAEIG